MSTIEEREGFRFRLMTVVFLYFVTGMVIRLFLLPIAVRLGGATVSNSATAVILALINTTAGFGVLALLLRSLVGKVGENFPGLILLGGLGWELVEAVPAAAEFHWGGGSWLVGALFGAASSYITLALVLVISLLTSDPAVRSSTT